MDGIPRPCDLRLSPVSVRFRGAVATAVNSFLRLAAAAERKSANIFIVSCSCQGPPRPDEIFVRLESPPPLVLAPLCLVRFPPGRFVCVYPRLWQGPGGLAGHAHHDPCSPLFHGCPEGTFLGSTLELTFFLGWPERCMIDGHIP